MGHSGRTADAQQWLVDANQRIEQHRKADLSVKVVDSLGQSVPGAEVRLEMTRHAFGFGTAVPAARINGTGSNDVMFRQKLLENFNQVVFENDMKWPPWIGQWGSGFNWNSTQNALNWLDANGLPTRGHYLSWATWSGDDAWGSSQNVNTLPARLLAHITDKATLVGNRVFEWDVINHPVGWLNDNYENRISAGLAFYADIIDHARSVAPAGMPMWINEDDIIAGGARAAEYERMIDYLVDNGSAPDGIGFQGHFVEEWGRIRTPQQVYAQIDRFAQFGLRLRTTEFDIDVGSGAFNEARQAELMHDYMVTMFSHPDMEAITMWGFWQGSHWRPNAALYRNDWSEKPALTAYRDLVFDQWWTDETGESNAAGEFDLRGFMGDYRLTVTLGGQEFALPDVQLTGDLAVEAMLPIVISPADFNGDFRVDGGDLANWTAGFGMSSGAARVDGDADGDQDVDGDDFLAWQRAWGAGVAAEATSVPEPAGALLAALGLTICATARRRRLG